LITGVPSVAARGVLFVAHSHSSSHGHHSSSHFGAAGGYEFGTGLLDGGLAGGAAEVWTGFAAAVEAGKVWGCVVVVADGGGDEAEEKDEWEEGEKRSHVVELRVF